MQTVAEPSPIQHVGDPPWTVTNDRLLDIDDYMAWGFRGGCRYPDGQLPWEQGQWRHNKKTDGLSLLVKIDLERDGLARLMFDREGREKGYTWKGVYDRNPEKVQEFCDMYMEGYAPWPVEGAKHNGCNQYAVYPDEYALERAMAAHIMKKPLYIWVTFQSPVNKNDPLTREEACRAACAEDFVCRSSPEVLREYIDKTWALDAMKSMHPDYYDQMAREGARRIAV